MNFSKLSFAKKIASTSPMMLLYEFLPPVVHMGKYITPESSVERAASAAIKCLNGFHVDAIYLPQIVDEEARGEGVKVDRPKRIDARQFGKALLMQNPQFEILITQVFPYFQNEENTREWVQHTLNDFLIKNLVVVGKAHALDKTAGFNVSQALSWLQCHYNAEKKAQYSFGAIAIEHRQNEAENLFAKTVAGAEFFTTQIFYESTMMLEMLRKYKALCDAHQIKPARIFLSVSPLSTKLDLKVMTSLLGYNLPESVRNYIFDETVPSGCEGNRSIEMVMDVLLKIFNEVYHEGQNIVGVPLGICVCHVTERNHRYALELLAEISKLKQTFCQNG